MQMRRVRPGPYRRLTIFRGSLPADVSKRENYTFFFFDREINSSISVSGGLQ